MKRLTTDSQRKRNSLRERSGLRAAAGFAGGRAATSTAREPEEGCAPHP